MSRIDVLAQEHWQRSYKFDTNVIKQIVDSRKDTDVNDLDKTYFLEKYEVFHFYQRFRFLWRSFSDSITWEQTLLFAIVINHKFTTGLTYKLWGNSDKINSNNLENILKSGDDKKTFSRVFETMLENYFNISEPTDSETIITFLIHCFESLENETVRGSCLKIVSLPMWSELNPTRYLCYQTSNIYQ